MAKGDGTGVPVDDPNHKTPIVLPPIRTAAASSPSASASPVPIPAGSPPWIDPGLVGETSFAQLFNTLTTYQIQEQPLEERAAKTILPAAAECNGVK